MNYLGQIDFGGITIKIGAYDTKLCRQALSDRHAHAVIPQRNNVRSWKDKKLGSLERNDLLKTVKLSSKNALEKVVWLSLVQFG